MNENLLQVLPKQIDSTDEASVMQRMTSFGRERGYIPNVVGLLGMYHCISHTIGRREGKKLGGSRESSGVVGRYVRRRMN